ncbi:MAG: PH domain-containing protein [Ardenticatenaceae bacterium]
MSVQKIQGRLKGRIWQGIIQSGVDISAIPEAEMDQLVNAVTERVVLEMDHLLGEAISQAEPEAEPEAEAEAEAEAEPEAEPEPTVVTEENEDEMEQILWEGRPFLSLGMYYTITSERIRIESGLLGKEREDIELVRVQDIDQSQSVTERMMNIGDIHIRSHDPSSPEIVLNNVPNPQDVHEILRQAVLKARKQHKLFYREEM